MSTQQHFISHRFYGLKPSSTLAINEQSKKLQSEGVEVTRLGLGQSPFPVPESVVEQLRQHAHEKDYLPVAGLEALREAIAAHLQKTRAVEFEAENIMVGPGTKELLYLLQVIYSGILLLPAPSWVSYAPQAQLAGTPTHWIPTTLSDGWRISAENLQQACLDNPGQRLIMILNYPNNPAGTSYSDEQLEKIARIARQYQVIIIADEIYWELSFSEQPGCLARHYPEGTIISTGLSKWCGAGGWRLGALAFPKALFWLRDALAVIASETFSAVSAPIQYAAITAFNGNAEIDCYVSNSRKIMQAILQYTAEVLKAGAIDCAQAEGGFYVMADFSRYRMELQKNNICNGRQLCARLLNDTGIAALPGCDFGLDAEALVVRLAMVDFDGKAALIACENDYKDDAIDTAFMKSHMSKTWLAPKTMVEWIKSMK